MGPLGPWPSTADTLSSSGTSSSSRTSSQRPHPPRRLSMPFKWLQRPSGKSLTHLDIYVGSLSGMSENLASMLADKAEQRSASVSVHALNDFDPTRFTNPRDLHRSRSHLTVFVVSTHFAGGPSPNAEVFSQWLRLASGEVYWTSTKLEMLAAGDIPPTAQGALVSEGIESSSLQRNQVCPANAGNPRRRSTLDHWRPRLNIIRGKSVKPVALFEGLQYTVFGVGNSMYLTYNAMGKFVDARMCALGAVRLCPLGLGDVSNNVYGDFAKWEAQILELLPDRPPRRATLWGIPTAATTVVIAAKIGRRHAQRVQDDKRIPPEDDQVYMPYPHATTCEAQDQLAQLINQRRCESVPMLSLQTSDWSHPRSRSDTLPAIKTTDSMIQSLYGDTVKLRFRCHYHPKDHHHNTKTTRAKLSPLRVTSGTKPDGHTRAGWRNSFTSSLGPARNAANIRHPCIAVKSITMLKRANDDQHAGQSDCNLSQLNEVSLVRLVLQDPDMTFQTADTLGYFPPNASEVVEEVGRRLGFDMDALAVFFFPGNTPSSSLGLDTTATATDKVYDQGQIQHPVASACDDRDRHLPFPSPCTVRTVLRDFLELHTVSREFVRVAAGFTTNPEEHETLENLATYDKIAEFEATFNTATAGMLRVLELAPSLHMSFELFVNLTPLLKPRLYSIASSHLLNAREFDMVVALGSRDAVHGLSVSNFRRLLGVPLDGNCSSNGGDGDCKSNCNQPRGKDSMAMDGNEVSLHKTATQSSASTRSTPRTLPTLPLLRGFVSPSMFKTPPDLSAPMVMVAHGIGIGPLRALLQHRKIEEEEAQRSGKNMGGLRLGQPASDEPSPSRESRSTRGKNLLFLGCSSRAALLFESELREWEREGFLELHVAYSREPDEPMQHVQDLIAAHKNEIVSVMTNSLEARFYMCGKTAMAKSVENLLADYQVDAESCSHWYRDALQTGRYIRGIFG